MRLNPIRSAQKCTTFLTLLLSGVVLPSIAAHTQSVAPDITCDGGSGEYSSQFPTGVTVSVGPMRNGSFAERACAARLSWRGGEADVASDAGQVGVDVLGANLGLGKPVVSFQIDKSGGGANREYRIYSLTTPPHLLYTLTGGGSYNAADTDLDGRVEIWTDDAEAVDGFEGIPKADLDFAPTVVLRFGGGRPLDVGSEFVSFYDDLITRIRTQIRPVDLSEFKQSDGKLSLSSSESSEQLHRLIRTKISAIEIVCAYLYSGREQQAWGALAEMWPAKDVDRIRTAISALHDRGMLHDIGRSERSPRGKRHALIYDAVNASTVVTNYNPYGGAPDPSQAEAKIVQPKSILLRRPPSPAGGGFPSANEMIELVVDSAGKVRSAKVIGGTDSALVSASAGWHFIPGFQGGVPVACRFRLSVWTLK